MLLDKTLYSYNDIMVKPAKVSYIEHRDECNVYKENGKLPIFTAPMSSVVDEFNYHLFESNKINAILPRNIDITVRYGNSCSGGWSAYSLHEFYECFCNEYGKFNSPAKALIDIANGHMNLMYEYVKKAKEIHGDNIIVMVGNIANPETYKVAYNAGVDYIRVGIGGGCFVKGTKVNTVNGLKNIEDLSNNDNVLTHNKNYKRINEIFEKDYKGKIFNINGIKCTPNHKFYVIKKEDKNKITEDNYNNFAFWIEAEKLNDNYLLINL